MWRNIKPLTSSQLRDFETEFNFPISEPLRSFLLTHNGAVPVSGELATTVRTRVIETLVDFNDRDTATGGWKMNDRLRKFLTRDRILIGLDTSANFICLEKSGGHQSICVWSHISGNFEPCVLDIPGILRTIG